MKALVLDSPGKLVMKDLPIPVPGEHELLIQTKAATICTSDLHDIQYNPFGIKLPMTMGHEGAGVVASVGMAVTAFKPGDEITAHPVMSCGQCVSCRRGLGHLCDNMSHLGIDKGGVFAEYFLIRQDRVRLKPASLDFAAATLMEPVCVCIEALERAQVGPGKNVLILGDGPFGILMSRLCRQYPDVRTLLLGRHGYRLAFGGESVIQINEKKVGNAEESIREATGGAGIDSAILCVGTSQAADLAISVLRSRGTLAIFSGIPGKPAVDLFKVHVKELTITGSCNDMGYLDRALECLQDPHLALPDVITTRLPFDEFERAFDLAANGKDQALKVSMLF